MMAARGLVPLKGHDAVLLLLQLAADSDPALAKSAGDALDKTPEGVLLAAAEAPLHPSMLDALAARYPSREDVLSRIAANASASDSTLADVALRCSEPVTEIIATNQERMLAAPSIIEALYKNKNTRMSTADRLIELAARNGVELEGIPAFKYHVEAIAGQLIPEPTDEPLPTDVAWQEALSDDGADENAIERDEVDGTETLKESYKPLSSKIRDMSASEKIRLSLVGDAAARAILVRDPNRLVAMAAISSPSMRDSEAIAVAHSKEVAEDILRYIGNKKEWLRSHELKRALMFNPKTPIAISMNFLSHMRPNDLQTLSRSRNVPNALKTVAKQRLEHKRNG
ncbi:MAG: hypothetical protein H5U40_13325 [Polyangiaceae bacterium]|nr:hypothetical protein [Polyangiaceae bacterium]